MQSKNVNNTGIHAWFWRGAHASHGCHKGAQGGREPDRSRHNKKSQWKKPNTCNDIPSPGPQVNRFDYLLVDKHKPGSASLFLLSAS